MRRALFVAALPLALLGSAELAVRLSAPLLAARIPAYYYRQLMGALLRESELLVWEGIPGAEAEIPNSRGERVSYRLNRQGWREREFTPAGQPLNGLLLGDSFSFGVGVPVEQRFGELLEKRIPGLHIWNLGEMGYAPDQHLLLAQRWLPPVPWSFLILQLANNDLADLSAHRWLRPHSLTGIPALLRAPESHARFSAFSELWNFFQYQRLEREEGALPEPVLREGLRRYELSLRETLKLARDRGVPALVLQASDWGEPVYGARLAGETRALVRFLARDYGATLWEAPVLPLLPAPDRHWAPEAHAQVAEALHRPLSELLRGGARVTIRK